MRLISKYLFYLYVVWFGIGVILVSLDILPESLQWANAFFLYVAGAVTFCYLLYAYRTFSAIYIFLCIFIISMTLEHLGVTYGWIFGSYDYEIYFGFKIAGVPIAIGFAWVMIVTSTGVITRRILASKENYFFHVVLSSFLAVLIDLIIDPVSFQLKEYWIWREEGPYYQIPTQNFIGWFITSLIIQTILYKTFKKIENKDRNWENRMIFLYFSVIGLFIVTALIGKLFLAAILVGSGSICLLWLLWKESKKIDLPKEE